MGLKSRNKGKVGEREFANLLTVEGFPASRGVQYQGGPDSADVKCDLLDDVHFEVKRCERLHVYDAIDQARRDAGGGKIPVVAHRKNDCEWLAILPIGDLLALLRERP